MTEEPEFKNKHERRKWYIERGLCPNGCGEMERQGKVFGCEKCGFSAIAEV